jgi:soluble lytic murein transglycosylase-like protein
MSPTVHVVGNAAPHPTDRIVAQALLDAAKRFNVPHELVRAVAWRESRYKPSLVSPKGAQGLMQIMPATGKGLGLADPFNPMQNAAAGAKYLRQLHTQYRQWPQALAAYNWGSGNVNRHPDPNQWPQGVVEYVLRVWDAAGWKLPSAIPVVQL